VYSTCLFCQSALGENTDLASFPVGRRIAFDAAKGRLWVVCPKCAQWNLTPLEERWEAVEQSESLFRTARMRASTAEIGIARLASGMDLIRIGKPLRPEFAAWRYGQALQRRHNIAMIGGGVLATAAVGAFFAGAAAGIPLIVGAIPFGALAAFANGRLFGGGENDASRALRLAGVAVGHGRIPPGAFWGTRGGDLTRMSFARGGGPDGWRLHIERNGERTDVSGSAAYRTVGLMLPGLNLFGASRRETEQAVANLDANGDPRAHFAKIVDKTCRTGHAYMPIGDLPSVIRLSLEMAAHEETERRALDGELALLTEQWRIAEEIAGIADNLLTPAADTAFVERVRRTSPPLSTPNSGGSTRRPPASLNDPP